MIAMPVVGFSVCAKDPERPDTTMYEASIPSEEARNMARRPTRSTENPAATAQIRFQTCKKPEIRVCWVTLLMPASSKASTR